MAVAALAVSDILAVAALAVSVISLGVSYTTLRRTKKSEEIRISREIWDRIDAHECITNHSGLLKNGL
jgi:hypothetical protein